MSRDLPATADKIAVPLTKRDLMKVIRELPDNTTFIFRTARRSPKTEREVTDIHDVVFYGGLTYVILGGYE